MSVLVKNFTERALWGTDWPHPNMKSHMPDDGKLVDIIEKLHPQRNCKESYWLQSNDYIGKLRLAVKAPT